MLSSKPTAKHPEHQELISLQLMSFLCWDEFFPSDFYSPGNRLNGKWKKTWWSHMKEPQRRISSSLSWWATDELHSFIVVDRLRGSHCFHCWELIMLCVLSLQFPWCFGGWTGSVMLVYYVVSELHPSVGLIQPLNQEHNITRLP